MATNRYLGVDPMLTNVAIGYQNADYIADLLMPSFQVLKQSGKHFIYDKGRFRGPANNAKRSTSSPSNEITLSLTTGTPYYCEDHALKQFVPDEDVENAITPTDPFFDATEFLAEQHKVSKEIEVATLLTSTSNLTQNVTLSGTSQWSDFSNSDPIKDIRTGKQTINASIYMDPNTLVLGKQVYDKLVDHPAFIERMKYSQLGVMTPELLARIVGVDRVIVGGAGKNTSKEGQTDAMSYIWGKNAILAYIAPTIRPKMVTLGFNYTWQLMQTERLRGTDEEDRTGTYIRVGNNYYNEKLVAASCGYLFATAVA